MCVFLFFFNDTATTEIYTLSLHDALPISRPHGARPRRPIPTGIRCPIRCASTSPAARSAATRTRSEEHTSELQSPCNLVCRLLLEKKKSNHVSTPRYRPVIARHPQPTQLL